MLPLLHLFIKQEARQAANRLVGYGCSYVLNFGHSEVLIKMTDEMPLLLTPRDKFVTLIYSVGNFLSIFLQERIGLRNVLSWLHRIYLLSLLMDLFARTELMPAYSLTF
jgi:hypothetical protein